MFDLRAILSIGLTVLSGTAAAATLQKGGDDYMQCIATLSGPIESGDAERLEALLITLRNDAEMNERARLNLSEDEPVFTTFGTQRICLDGPGGSLTEAIRMGDILYSEQLGTAVARDASCQSACAVLFLAGTELLTGDGATGPNRILHATGRLGFHAPSLAVPENQYSKAAVEKAYRIAIAGLGEISARKRIWTLSDSILNTILTTPPSDMRFVETLFDAGQWGFPVVGTYYPRDVTPLAAANACTKDYAFQVGVDPSFKPIWDDWSTFDKPRYGYGPQKIDTPDGPAYTLFGYGDEGAMKGCTLALPTEAPGAFDTPAASGWAWPYPNGTIGWGDGAAKGVMPAMFYDNRLRLSDIARARDDEIEFRAVTDLTPPDKDLRVSGTCSVWRGQVQRDAETCDLHHLEITSAELQTRSDRVFTWPSGSKTSVLTVRNANGSVDTFVNGSDATEVYDWENPPVPDGTCWLNRNSGNTFCFLEAG